MARPSYIIYNSAMATTAAPVAQPTGTTVRTMMQLKPATGYCGKVIAWGASFDASAAITPGKLELIETDVGATALTTAFAVGDIQQFSTPNASFTNTAGTSGVPLNLGTSASGFSTAAVTEGTTTASRMCDVQLIDPAFSPYGQTFVLAREFELIPQRFLRVRATFGTTVNLIVWVLLEF